MTRHLSVVLALLIACVTFAGTLHAQEPERRAGSVRLTHRTGGIVVRSARRPDRPDTLGPTNTYRLRSGEIVEIVVEDPNPLLFTYAATDIDLKMIHYRCGKGGAADRVRHLHIGYTGNQHIKVFADRRGCRCRYRKRG